MTAPELILDDIMPRSWVLETTGGSWEWLPVVAGVASHNNARSMPLPAGGGWTIMVASALTVDSHLRLDDGEGNIVLARIPAISAADTMVTVVVQAPVKKAGAIHIQSQGKAVAGHRVLVTASPSPLSTG